MFERLSGEQLAPTGRVADACSNDDSLLSDLPPDLPPDPLSAAEVEAQFEAMIAGTDPGSCSAGSGPGLRLGPEGPGPVRHPDRAVVPRGCAAGRWVGGGPGSGDVESRAARRCSAGRRDHRVRSGRGVGGRAAGPVVGGVRAASPGGSPRGRADGHRLGDEPLRPRRDRSRAAPGPGHRRRPSAPGGAVDRCAARDGAGLAGRPPRPHQSPGHPRCHRSPRPGQGGRGAGPGPAPRRRPDRRTATRGAGAGGDRGGHRRRRGTPQGGAAGAAGRGHPGPRRYGVAVGAAPRPGRPVGLRVVDPPGPRHGRPRLTGHGRPPRGPAHRVADRPAHRCCRRRDPRWRAGHRRPGRHLDQQPGRRHRPTTRPTTRRPHPARTAAQPAAPLAARPAPARSPSRAGSRCPNRSTPANP
jgi:hypothetical protein